MLYTSLFEPGVLAFMGTWYGPDWGHTWCTKADILAQAKRTNARVICATTIDIQSGSFPAMEKAGFQRFAYGCRNGAPGYIQLWRMENPYPANEIEPTAGTLTPPNRTFCCGCHYGTPKGDRPYKPNIFRWPLLWVGKHKPLGFRSKCLNLAPGWYVVGRAGVRPNK
jgi:hypothetical protein